jgi:hypothetical protein
VSSDTGSGSGITSQQESMVEGENSDFTAILVFQSVHLAQSSTRTSLPASLELIIGNLPTQEIGTRFRHVASSVVLASQVEAIDHISVKMRKFGGFRASIWGSQHFLVSLAHPNARVTIVTNDIVQGMAVADLG